jgi:spoIIIJ-associated protein
VILIIGIDRGIMNMITVSAKTVNDAITEASIELGIASTDMEYEVVEEGSAGFLGIGKKQAVIKAWKKEDKPAKKEVKKESKKEVKKEEPKKEVVKKETPKEEVKEEPEVQVEEEAPVKEEKHVEVTQETKDACEKFLVDVLKTMGMEVKLTSSIDEDGALSIDMEGENMGILIGKRGQTLDSLQYLTNRVANKMQEGYVRVKLDTENYRQRRKETLENLAKNIAHKVKRTKKSVSLEPMNPYERRIIHSALQGDKYVSTHSEGEEPYRRVVVTLNRK